MVVRLRFWAVIAGLLMVLLQGLICLGWVIYAALHGFFSALPLVTGAMCLVALILVPLAIGPTRRFARARAALLAD